MSLDLTKVASQVEEMVARLESGASKGRERFDCALDTLRSQADSLEHLRGKIISSKTTWLVAGLVDRLDKRYKAPPLPADFIVIATDGSHIDVDRHQSTRCYLINIGSVLLYYGAQSKAVLDSFPRLYAEDKDLVITSPAGRGREQRIEDVLLGAKRSVDECQRLAELVAELPAGSSALALMDGSLILWGLAAYPEFVTEVLLDRGFLVYFSEIRKLSKDRRLALASYISFPRSTDVINVLRVALCPYEPPDCDRHCSNKEDPDCDKVAGIQDRELFASLLAEGERSALFISRSSVVQKHYGENSVYFFYLRVDEEIARVEIPQWVATDESRLALVHSLVLDQCRLGHGYPVALSEAHEQAVVREADRQSFWQLVESSVVGEHLPSHSS
ncbi:DNA double-strand break repair nuclease NurA, partial [Chloroflexota bacterium]